MSNSLQLRFEANVKRESPDHRSGDRDPLAFELEKLRDDWAREHAVDREDRAQFTPNLPGELSFFAMPEWLLLAYEQHREASDLGDVFRIANGLHDWVDALVVVAPQVICSGIESVWKACCDPFHNEMDRATRGSKPRMYFAPSECDNDHLQSLRARLIGGGYGDLGAESRFAMVCCGRDAATEVRANLLREWQIGIEQIPDDLPSPNTTFHCGSQDGGSQDVTRGDGDADAHSSQAIAQQLHLPKRLDQREWILSPAGLLPAAFLGLDCIQLLVGAANLNEHFLSASFEQNLVLQYIAARSVAFESGRARVITDQVCLQPLLNWIAGDQPLSVTQTPSGAGPLLRYRVLAPRTDPLPVPLDVDVDDTMSQAASSTGSDSSPAECERADCLTLPLLDFRVLGEWIQLELISRQFLKRLATG